MASRDYAQGNRSGGRRPKRGGGGGPTPGWAGLVAGLAIGLAVAAFVYIKRPAQPLLGGQPTAGEAAEPARKPSKPKEMVKLPPREKPRFTFYELLPSEEVVIPRGEDKTAAKPAAGDSYIIQVASFRSKEEADQQKASIALLGIESRIESVTIDGSDTFYRVRVGPLKDFGKVQIISNRLADNGIEPLVVKVKK